MDAASTICPNPTEGVFKYTVVTSGRPVVDGLHHGDLPVPADFLRSKQGPEARLGKRQLAKLSSCGVLPPVKGRDLKLHSFKKPSIHPLDPTEMSDYSPRTTTFVNGRPSSSVSTPKHHPFTPTSAAAGALAGPSHASPDSVRDGSATTRDDLEDVASVDSAPGAMRFLTTRARDSLPGGLQPEAVPASARLALSRFPHDLSTTDESLDMYLEQFFPELHSMSDAELLRLMDPNPSAPSVPHRSSTLAILQDMLLTQGTYAGPSLKQHNSTASNPASSNWSSMASDEHNSHNWSEAPSQNWRSPRSPSPGPATWMSWPSATQQQQSRKRQRSLEGIEDLEWPALAEHVPALSGEVPPSKRQMLQHRPLGLPQHAGAEHGPSAALDRHLLYGMPPSSSAAAAPQAHEGAPRPNPFASVSKQALLQPGQLHRQPLDLQSYMSMQSSATAHSHRLGCSPTLASSGESVSCSRGPLEHTIEPASVLEQALRDLRSKPEAHVC